MPAVEATLMVLSLWAPLSWPGLPVVAVVEIVQARTAAEAARLVVQPTGKLPTLLEGVLVELAVEAALAGMWLPTGAFVKVRAATMVARLAAHSNLVLLQGVIMLSPMMDKRTF